MQYLVCQEVGTVYFATQDHAGQMALHGSPLDENGSFDNDDAFVVEVTDELPAIVMAKIAATFPSVGLRLRLEERA
jgi:hypothetical protein